MTELAFEFGYKVANDDRWHTGYVRAETSRDAEVKLEWFMDHWLIPETFLRTHVPDNCLPADAEEFMFFFFHI